jgi:cbb3-type cytochrome oxidase subunit 1
MLARIGPMDRTVHSFLMASLAWLACGITLGAAMAAQPALTTYRLAQTLILLLGFVTMTLYGVAYHLVPRLVQFPLHSRRAASCQWWIANAGLVLLVVGVVLRTAGDARGAPVLATGGAMFVAGGYLFVYVLWRTVDGPPAMRAIMRRNSGLARR